MGLSFVECCSLEDADQLLEGGGVNGDDGGGERMDIEGEGGDVGVVKEWILKVREEMLVWETMSKISWMREA